MNQQSSKMPCIASLAAAVAIVAGPASAHHNYVAHYDTKTPMVTVTGKVNSFWFVNPHIRIYVDVTNAETSQNEVWIAEGRSRAIMAREGWVGDEIKKGDTITLSGTLARSPEMKTHVLLGDELSVNGKKLHAGPLETNLKHFQLGGEGAATAASHLDDGARDEANSQAQDKVDGK